MRGFDLKKFKKMSSDKASTILKHADGHELKISHKHLSPKLKAELDKLPVHEQKMAKGGMVRHYAEGTEDEPIQPEPQKERSFSEDMANAWDTVKKGFNNYDEKVEPEQQGADFASRYNVAENKPQQQPQSPVVINVGSAQPQQPQQQSAAPAEEAAPPQPAPAPAAAQAAPRKAPAQRAPAQTQPAPTLAPAAPAKPPEPAQTEQTAAQASEDMAKQPLAMPQTAADQNQKTYEKSYQDYVKEHAAEFAQEDAAWQHDLQNGHIEPKTYRDLYAKKDTLGKVGMIFGLMLSGIGSGMSGQQNMALEMMNNEIKNDLDAQVKSKEGARNFLQLNYQHEFQLAQQKLFEKQGNLTEAQIQQVRTEAALKARTLTIMQMNSAALHNQAQLVAKMPDGPQKEQAKELLAMMGTAVTAENANVADIAASRLALFNQAGGGANTTAMRMVPGMEGVAKSMEEKTIPGIGTAKIPVPQNKRDELEAMNTLDYKTNDLLNFIDEHKGTFNPQTRRVAEQKAEEMVNFYNSSIKGGVLTEGRLKWLDSQINKNPTSIIQDIMGNTARLREIRDSNAERKDIMLRQLGIKTTPHAPSGGSQEGQTSVSKSGKPIVFKGGKWVYQ